VKAIYKLNIFIISVCDVLNFNPTNLLTYGSAFVFRCGIIGFIFIVIFFLIYGFIDLYGGVILKFLLNFVKLVCCV
jgi:hypothetical protein